MKSSRHVLILSLAVFGLAACSLILDSKPGAGDGDADVQGEADTEEGSDGEGEEDVFHEDGYDADADGADMSDAQEVEDEETEPPVTYWARTYGGTFDDEAHAVTVLPDGSFVMAGTTNSFHSSMGSWKEMWIVKLDAAGDIVWQKVLGGDGDDVAYSVIPAGDGGVAAAGYTESYGPAGANGIIVKLDAAGEIAWKIILGGDYDDRFFSIAGAGSGGFVAAGASDSFTTGIAVWVVEVDAEGFKEREGCFIQPSGSGDLKAGAIQSFTDGSFALTGTFKAGGSDQESVLVMKIGSTGACAWATSIDPSTILDDRGMGILAMPDGTSVVAARDLAAGTAHSRAWLVEMSDAGSVSKNLVLESAGDDVPFGLVQAPDSGFVLFGMTDSPHPGNYDAMMLKADWDSGPAWGRTYGGEEDDGADGSLPVVPHAFSRVPTGGYVAAGSTGSFGAGARDAWVLRVDDSGGPGGGCSDVVQDFAQDMAPDPYYAGSGLTVTSSVAVSTLYVGSLASGDPAASVNEQCPE